jgi:hypothetical protein
MRACAFGELLRRFRGDRHQTGELPGCRGLGCYCEHKSGNRGRDGIEVFARSPFVFTFSAGQLTRICVYQEEEQALKAVGLQE